MGLKESITSIAVAMVVATVTTNVTAQEPRPCTSRITRANVVECAVAASLAVEAERRELEAAEARRTAVSPLLPANPVLALSAGRRSIPATQVTNWYATLSQEIEIAGQRGTRRAAAEAGAEAQSKRVALARRQTAAAALEAFFEAVAAREEERLVARLAAATSALAVAAHARADKGLIAPIDADVADATTLRVVQAKLAAGRRVARSHGALATLLGLDPAAALVVEGDLEPIPGVEEAVARAATATAQRPEVAALDAQRRAHELRGDAYRRSRIPNPTVSFIAQNDGFDEHVFGAGVAFPIPLPGNVGRTYVGEIAESEALARRSEVDRERALREIRLEIATAAQAYASRTEEVRAFSRETLAHAEASLSALAEELTAGRVAVRDAVVAEQALLDLLRADVEARRARCLASVDLARAAGVPLEGRTR